mgnify:CR=1 FL=1
MTRINIGINPQRLKTKHLIAEHREIKRIPNTISSGKAKITGIPETFRLGTGHVKFFYDKQEYLRKRYLSIYAECVKRGLNVTNFIDCWNDIPQELMNDYTPTDKDIEIITERLNERNALI